GGADGSGGSTGGTSGADEVAPSMGCGEAAPNAGNATIDVDGLERQYILALPEDYAPEKPYKLIFTWHPWGGSAQQDAGSGPSGSPATGPEATTAYAVLLRERPFSSLPRASTLEATERAGGMQMVRTSRSWKQ